MRGQIAWGVSTLISILVLGPVTACASEEGQGHPPSEASAPGSRPVRPGLDVLLSDSLHLVRDRRVGLITNHTGVDHLGRSGIDLLHEAPGVELVALYSPEHGIRGTALAGVLVDSSRDAATGLPVHSLYGSTRKPTPAMLQGVDILLFDIQDVGSRYYTYVYTMALAMEAAGEAGIPLVVLDRPNPIGGEQVQGNVLDPEFSSFVGMYPLPMRHGMTPGELARLFRSHFGVEVELHVVPVDGLRRDMLFPATGLPWIPPSPNMPSVESALHYPGSCLFEGTNLSVGRGTDEAFQVTGAPWLDGPALVTALARWPLAGVRFEAARFTPDAPGDGKFDGEELQGVRWIVTDPERYDPVEAGIAVLVETRRQAPDRWEWNAAHFDLLAGTDALRRALDALPAEGSAEPAPLLSSLTRGWAAQRAAFAPLRDAALLAAYDVPATP